MWSLTNYQRVAGNPSGILELQGRAAELTRRHGQLIAEAAGVPGVRMLLTSPAGVGLHRQGLAIDFQAGVGNNAAHQAIADVIYNNWGRLGVRYMAWNGYEWGGDWGGRDRVRPQTINYGGSDPFHRNHVHVDFHANAKVHTGPLPYERTWLDMVSESDLRRIIREEIPKAQVRQETGSSRTDTIDVSVRNLLSITDQTRTRATSALNAAAEARDGKGMWRRDFDGNRSPAEVVARDTLINAQRASERSLNALSRLASLEGLVREVARREGVGADEIEAIVAEHAVDPDELAASFLSRALGPLTEAITLAVAEMDESTAEDIADAVLAQVAAALTRND